MTDMEKKIAPADVLFFIANIEDARDLDFLDDVNLWSWLDSMQLGLREITQCIAKYEDRYEEDWVPNPENPAHMQTLIRWALKWLQCRVANPKSSQKWNKLGREMELIVENMLKSTNLSLIHI